MWIVTLCLKREENIGCACYPTLFLYLYKILLNLKKNDVSVACTRCFEVKEMAANA